MNNIRKLLAGVALVSAMAAGAAQASTVLSDNFDGETAPGVSQLNFAGFDNWDVTGQVDLVATPNPYGTSGSGAYVDLDGTSGPGSITTKTAYSFNAGDHVVLTFDLSGSQRSNSSDNFLAFLQYSGATTVNNLNIYGTSFGTQTGVTNSGTSFFLAGNSPFTTKTISFDAGTSGSLKVNFGTTSADNVGPLIDNVNLSIGAAVPEPATWAMMITGFGLAGMALRRRRAITA
jgi:hypothetical protein